jgi:peroxiredoxin family protein
MTPSLVVFLHSHAYDRLYQATTMLLTASAMGWRCHLFLFYHALASFDAGTWDEVNITTCSDPHGAAELPVPRWLETLEHNFEASNHPSLYSMLDKARTESGGLKVCACSTAVRLLDLSPQAVRERVDEIVGLPTMMRIAENATHVIYI